MEGLEPVLLLFWFVFVGYRLGTMRLAIKLNQVSAANDNVLEAWQVYSAQHDVWGFVTAIQLTKSVPLSLEGTVVRVKINFKDEWYKMVAVPNVDAKKQVSSAWTFKPL